MHNITTLLELYSHPPFATPHKWILSARFTIAVFVPSSKNRLLMLHTVNLTQVCSIMTGYTVAPDCLTDFLYNRYPSAASKRRVGSTSHFLNMRWEHRMEPEIQKRFLNGCVIEMMKTIRDEEIYTTWVHDMSCRDITHLKSKGWLFFFT